MGVRLVGAATGTSQSVGPFAPGDRGGRSRAIIPTSINACTPASPIERQENSRLGLCYPWRDGYERMFPNLISRVRFLGMKTKRGYEGTAFYAPDGGWRRSIESSLI